MGTIGEPATGLWSCPDCGGVVTNAQRVRCDTCIDADPRQTSDVRCRRASAIAARRRASEDWDAAGGLGAFDPDDWPAIQAGLADVKLSDIVAATGLSKGFASVVRAGNTRPHPSHWPALAALSDRTPSSAVTSRGSAAQSDTETGRGE
jgi:hypothetical protein